MVYRNRMGAAVAAMAISALSFGQIYSNRGDDVRAPALNAKTLSKSGVTAPAGGYWSEVQNDTGNTLESNTSAGASGYMTGTTGAFRLADNFAVTNGEATVSTVRIFGYQTNLAAATPLVTSVSMRIWNGRPGDGTSTQLVDYPTCPFTETTTFVVAASGATTFSGNVFRVFNTTTPAPGTAPGTTRAVRAITCTLPSPITLPDGGDYWFDWQITSTAGTLICFMPNTTHEGSRQPQNPAGGGNARQFITTPAWADSVDTGNPATAPDHVMEHTFQLAGLLTRYPDAYAVTGGMNFGGNLASLARSDNDRAIILCDENDPNGQIGAVCNTTMPFMGANYVGDLEVQLESSSTRSDQTEFVRLFNTSTTVFNLIGSHTTTLADTQYSYNIVGAGNYVSAARNVGIQITVIPNADIDAGDGWTDSYDVIRIRCGS